MKNNKRNENLCKDKRILAATVDYSILIVTTLCINSCLPVSIFIGPLKIYIKFIVDVFYMLSYMVFKDLLFRNASLGKKLFGLTIVDRQTQSIPKVSVLLLRNLIEVIPIVFWTDLQSILKGRPKSVDIKLQTDVI